MKLHEYYREDIRLSLKSNKSPLLDSVNKIIKSDRLKPVEKLAVTKNKFNHDLYKARAKYQQKKLPRFCFLPIQKKTSSALHKKLREQQLKEFRLFGEYLIQFGLTHHIPENIRFTL